MKKYLSMLVATVLLFVLQINLLSCSSPKSNIPTQGTFAKEIAGYGKPVMVDFGSTSCVPCKMMVPVLEELKTKYAKEMETIFVHVNEDPDKTQEFAIKMIPTQIFFDAKGKELERHTGFISIEDILKTFAKYEIVIP